MKWIPIIAALGVTMLPVAGRAAESARPAPASSVFAKPLSLPEAIDIALRQNGTIQKAKRDLRTAYGLVIETRAVALPRLRLTGNFTQKDENFIEQFPFAPSAGQQNYSVDLQLVQSIYEGGRVGSALRAAKLSREQAVAQYQATVFDTVQEVRTGYYDVLLAEQQITVQEASVKLLTRELEDQNRRFDAGTVPRFNLLRAEVELANSKPKLIRARNSFRISKNNLANLLGQSWPESAVDELPLKLSGSMEVPPFALNLGQAMAKAQTQRPELTVLAKGKGLRDEGIINAKSGYKPSLQAFAGYGVHNSMFTDDLKNGVHGWSVGAQMRWDIFDGLLTKGKVDQANAQAEKAQIELEDTARKIELEVRTAYSNYTEAQEVLESQKKVLERAEESLRLANARSEAGTGTQLDVLSAQTALTESRTIQVQAQRDLAVALAKLERAVGQQVATPEMPKK